jgi:hypothetical protein
MRRIPQTFVLISLLCVATSPAFAQEKKEAIEHYDRGVALYKVSSYEAALVEFESAYRASGNFRLLYNIGLCRMETKDPVGAIEAFRRYLADGGDLVEKAKRDDVNEQIQKLQLSVTKVVVRSNAPAGTELFVDDEKVGTFPLAGPLPVKVGTRRFTATLGTRTTTRVVAVTGGDSPPIELVLPSAPVVETEGTSPQKVVVVPQQPGASTPQGPGFPWFPWALAGAFGAGATVTGILAVGARNDAALAQARFANRTPDIEPAQNRANTFGLVTDILLGATIITAGIATVVTIRHVRKPSVVEPASAALQVGPRGAAIVGSF